MKGIVSLDRELGKVRFKTSRLVELERLPKSEGTELVKKLVEVQLLVKELLDGRGKGDSGETPRVSVS